MDLTEFLLARISEDEQVARDAIRQHEPAIASFKVGRPPDMEDLPEESAAHWAGGSDESESGYYRQAVWAGDGIATICEMHSESDAASPAHIARWDPARVLAEVEAKRQIVERYGRLDEESSDPVESGWAQGLGEAVRFLALPYADHPGYRFEWAPSVRT